MTNKEIQTQFNHQLDIDRQCAILLEQVRLHIIDGKEAIKRLIEFYRRIK